MSEHCSLYSVSKLLSERDRLAKTPFSNDPNKQYTVYAAALPTTVTSHSLRHTASHNWYHSVAYPGGGQGGHGPPRNEKKHEKTHAKTHEKTHEK